MLEHTKVVEWLEHPFWEIRGTGLSHPILKHAKVVWMIRTSLLRIQRHWTHSLCWNMQRLFEWSEYFSWEMRGTGLTSYVGMFDWSEHLSWEMRGTGLTPYVRTCKGCLIDQNISSKKSEALDSQPMLEHAKVVWVIMTSFLRNQRHWTHRLCWNMQRSFEWSEHLFWEIRGTGLTSYVGTCNGCLSDQNIFSERNQRH